MVLAQLSGCNPATNAVFRNSLDYPVKVTLLNLQKQTYCTIIVRPHTINMCDEQYGTAVVTSLSGRIISSSTFPQPTSERYLDFDRHMRYFEIKSGGLVAVAISKGREWLAEAKEAGQGVK